MDLSEFGIISCKLIDKFSLLIDNYIDKKFNSIGFFYKINEEYYVTIFNIYDTNIISWIPENTKLSLIIDNENVEFLNFYCFKDRKYYLNINDFNINITLKKIFEILSNIKYTNYKIGIENLLNNTKSQENGFSIVNSLFDKKINDGIYPYNNLNIQTYKSLKNTKFEMKINENIDFFFNCLSKLYIDGKYIPFREKKNNVNFSLYLNESFYNGEINIYELNKYINEFNEIFDLQLDNIFTDNSSLTIVNNTDFKENNRFEEIKKLGNYLKEISEKIKNKEYIIIDFNKILNIYNNVIKNLNIETLKISDEFCSINASINLSSEEKINTSYQIISTYETNYDKFKDDELEEILINLNYYENFNKIKMDIRKEIEKRKTI